jgi:hypothetical protein
MIEIYDSISNWSFKLLEPDFSKHNLNQLITAYVSSLLEEKSLNDNDDKISVVELYNLSSQKNDFIHYQDLADTCLFREIINYKNNKFSSLQKTFGKIGYYNCYQISFKQLEVYKDLYDNFELISTITKQKIKNVSSCFEGN